MRNVKSTPVAPGTRTLSPVMAPSETKIARTSGAKCDRILSLRQFTYTRQHQPTADVALPIRDEIDDRENAGSLRRLGAGLLQSRFTSGQYARRAPGESLA